MNKGLVNPLRSFALFVLLTTAAALLALDLFADSSKKGPAKEPPIQWLSLQYATVEGYQVDLIYRRYPPTVALRIVYSAKQLEQLDDLSPSFDKRLQILTDEVRRLTSFGAREIAEGYILELKGYPLWRPYSETNEIVGAADYLIFGDHAKLEGKKIVATGGKKPSEKYLKTQSTD